MMKLHRINVNDSVVPCTMDCDLQLLFSDILPHFYSGCRIYIQKVTCDIKGCGEQVQVNGFVSRMVTHFIAITEIRDITKMQFG